MKKQQPSKKIKTKNYQRLSFLALFLAFALILGSLIGNDKDSDKAGFASKGNTDHSTDTSHSTEVRICEAPCILSFNPSRWTPPQGVTQPDDVGREIARSLGMTGEGWSEGVMSICSREFSESADVTGCYLSFFNIALEGACVGGQSPSDVAWNTLQANGIEDRNAYSGTEETQRCLNARRDCQEACGSIPDGELLNTCLTRLKTINPACG